MSGPKAPGAIHRKKQKAQTRDLILTTARNLFEKKGFEKTTMRIIAAETQMGYGTVFKHFANKQELLAVCLHEDIETVLVDAFATLPKTERLKPRFMHIASNLIRHYALRPQLSKTLIEQIILVNGSSKSILDNQVNRFLKMLGSLIQESKACGAIREDIDDNLLSLSLFTTYIATLAFSLRQSQFDPEQTIDTLDRLIDLHMSGISPKNA